MSDEIKNAEKKGVILKTVFIIIVLVMLGVVVYLNVYFGRITSKATNVNIPVVTPVVPEKPVTIANPAATNCVAQGGTSKIENKPDGSQYGVCYFDDNRQCEEWALLRGDCPVGGFKVTGYITPAAVFCAISGGTYNITGASQTANPEKEAGTCTFKNGKKCDVWQFYNGTCSNSLE